MRRRIIPGMTPTTKPIKTPAIKQKIEDPDTMVTKALNKDSII